MQQPTTRERASAVALILTCITLLVVLMMGVG